MQEKDLAFSRLSDIYGERDPDNLSPNWRPFGTGTGIGRGYRQSEEEVKENFRKRSLERMQDRRQKMEAGGQ